MSTKSLQLIFLLMGVVCTGWAHAYLPHDRPSGDGADLVPSPAVAKVMSLGFDALLADYHWLEAVQIVGAAPVVQEEEARDIGKLIDVVTTLNPHVDHPYRFAAVWLTHDEELVREGIRLLRRAIEYHPDEWRNHFYLGFNHFFYLQEFERAAAALGAASALPGSPAYLPRLVARLHSQSSELEVAEVFLRQLLEDTDREEVRAKVQGALDEIELEHKARLLDRAREAHRRRTGRDIRRVEDLATGPDRVLEALPSPEPDAIPESLSRGSTWRIDPETDRIVSSYVGSRYEVHFSAVDRKRLERADARSDRRGAQARGRASSKRDGAVTHGASAGGER